MPHESFSRKPARKEPITFDWEGEKFTAKPRLVMGPIMQLLEEAEAIGFTYAATRFVIGQIDPGPDAEPDENGKMPPNQQDRFTALLGEDIDQDGILGIHRYLMERYANDEGDEDGTRPTVPSAG